MGAWGFSGRANFDTFAIQTPPTDTEIAKASKALRGGNPNWRLLVPLGCRFGRRDAIAPSRGPDLPPHSLTRWERPVVNLWIPSTADRESDACVRTVRENETRGCTRTRVSGYLAPRRPARRRSTKRCDFSWVPHPSIEHHRRLRFLVPSRNSHEQRPQRLTLSRSSEVRSSIAA
jgi:hypothetical protein